MTLAIFLNHSDPSDRLLTLKFALDPADEARRCLTCAKSTVVHPMHAQAWSSTTRYEPSPFAVVFCSKKRVQFNLFAVLLHLMLHEHDLAHLLLHPLPIHHSRLVSLACRPFKVQLLERAGQRCVHLILRRLPPLRPQAHVRA